MSRVIKVSILVILGVFIPAAVWGYANAAANGLGGPHRKINEIALKKFYALAKNDPILKNYDFEPKAIDCGFTANGKDHPFVVECKSVTESGDWYKADLLIPENLPWLPTYIKEEVTQRPFSWWIIEGGYSADEPESYMALRHFYDPAERAYDKNTSKYVDYLTDDLDPYISPLLMGNNPKMNAKTWALTESPYALNTGYAAEYKAFTVPVSEKSAYYGKAWRCFGETMHLLADMTVPAHVRNDSHPGALSQRWQKIKNLKADPYETFATAEQIADYADYTVDLALQHWIDKCLRSSDLFDMIATYTNANFFSVDTISGTDKVTGKHVTNFNAQPKEYDSPKLDDYIFDPNGKSDGSGYYTTQDGTYKIVRRRSDGQHTIDDACVLDQASRLIPIAVAANVRLIDCFIPRVTVEIKSFDQTAGVCKCHVSAYAWDNAKSKYVKSSEPVFPCLEYNAVAFVTAGQQSKAYWLAIDNVNDGDFDVKIADIAKDISKIVIGIDMGGILVKSNPFEIKPAVQQTKPKAKKKASTPKNVDAAPAIPNPLVERSRVVDFSLMTLGHYSDGTDRGLVIQIPGGTATWSGLTFITTGSRDRGSGKETWSITGTVSKDYTVLTQVIAEHTVTTDSGMLTEKATLTNLPMGTTNSDEISFYALSSNAKKCVVSVESTWQNDGSSQPSRSVTSWEMNDSSTVNVGFAR